MALNGGGAVATDSGSSTTFSYVTVEAGQSLWQLAQTLAPTADPRDVIAEIVSLNQIKGEIQPGQRLAIPAGY
jgi:LysM repeat protein